LTPNVCSSDTRVMNDPLKLYGETENL
jgi:hypothetical protein